MSATGAVDIGSLRDVLNEVRKDLLDFGMRNPLLNFRPLKTRGVEVLPSNGAAIFEALVTDGQALSFGSGLGRSQRPQLLLANSDSPHPPEESLWRRPAAEQDALWSTDAFSHGELSVAHGEKELEDRLLNTSYAARTSIEEQGVNTLFLALGMVSWHDPASPDDMHSAPLVLIPVELGRESAADGFKLRYSGDDVSPNLCLVEFLKQFEIQLDDAGDMEEFEVDSYFDKFQRAIAAQKSWAVDRSAVSLGFFSFSKFLMYRDLDSTTWPNPDLILKHDILRKLLGNGSFAGEGSFVADDASIDEQLARTDCFHVLDADSTQTLALLDVASGRSMVVQGPPGTGKSQTIVNMIADAVATGKKVLFVSEKQAALTVVKQRLDKLNLGDPCLELHSNKARKRDVIQELKRTSNLDLTHTAPRTSETMALAQTRDDLNRYCKDVNRGVGASQERPIDLFGQILAAKENLNDIEIPYVDLSRSIEWDAAETNRRRTLVKSLEDRLGRVGVPVEHPFWGSAVRVLLPSDRDRLKHSCTIAVVSVASLGQFSTSLAKLVGCEAPASPDETRELHKVASRVAGAPDLSGLNVASESWATKRPSIIEALVEGNRLRIILDKWSKKLTDEAWSTDVAELRTTIEELSGVWWRFLSGQWRATERKIKTLVSSPKSVTRTDFIAIVDAISNARNCEAVIASHDITMSDLFRASWDGRNSDWQKLGEQSAWMYEFHNDRKAGLVPAWVAEFIANGASLVELR